MAHYEINHYPNFMTFLLIWVDDEPTVVSNSMSLYEAREYIRTIYRSRGVEAVLTETQIEDGDYYGDYHGSYTRVESQDISILTSATGSVALEALAVLSLVIVAVLIGFLIGYASGKTAGRGDAAAQAVSWERARIADCSLEDAHKGFCTIPCSTDTDCLEKNGQRDH